MVHQVAKETNGCTPGPVSGVRLVRPACPLPATGDIVDGRYRLDRLGGRGGMATVWRALDEVTGDIVALKLHSRRHADPVRLLHEARVLGSLRHAGVVRYLAHGDPPGSPYLAMEWLEGEDLSARHQRGPLTIEEALAVGLRLADALDAVHAAGVIHCDVKPSNVLLCGATAADARLVDFGVSQPRGGGADVPWARGAMVGTPGYMAPEQFTGEHEVDARADLFALGSLLFECLAGVAPFAGKHPMDTLRRTVQDPVPCVGSLRDGVPDELSGLIATLLARRPDDRPATAAAVAACLQRCGAGREAAVVASPT
ncbi:MAG: serine/threonine-protein kinase [Polyangiaceae bacterium]